MKGEWLERLNIEKDGREWDSVYKGIYRPLESGEEWVHTAEEEEKKKKKWY